MGRYLMKKAFIMRFVFDVSEPRKFQISVKNLATIDAHDGMIVYVPACLISSSKLGKVCLYFISAWGLRLLVQQRWAILGPRSVGRVTIQILTLSFYPADSGEFYRLRFIYGYFREFPV